MTESSKKTVSCCCILILLSILIIIFVLNWNTRDAFVSPVWFTVDGGGFFFFLTVATNGKYNYQSLIFHIQLLYKHNETHLARSSCVCHTRMNTSEHRRSTLQFTDQTTYRSCHTATTNIDVCLIEICCSSEFV